MTFKEFPPAVDGGPDPLPEVIATSHVIGGHTTSGKTGTTVARSFGAIAIYDGHRADVGRVLTDATWHHFINVNLTGENGTAGPKGLGFLASTAGQDVYDEIKAYFLNIAQWLSPPKKISCMRSWALIYVIYSHRLTEVYDTAVRLENASLIDLVLLGRHARDAIGRFAGQCQTLRWTWDFVIAEIEFLPFIDMGDPWRPRKRKMDELRDLETLDLFDFEWVGDAALGGAILALREEAFPLNQKLLDNFDELGDKLTRKGAKRANERVVPFIQKAVADFTDSFKKVGHRC